MSGRRVNWIAGALEILNQLVHNSTEAEKGGEI